MTDIKGKLSDGKNYLKNYWSGVFNVYVILTSIGILCSTVPFFFYKLTKDQHAQCIKEMQERVGEVSFHAGQEVLESAEN